MKRRKEADAPSHEEFSVRLHTLIWDLMRLEVDYKGTYLAAYGPAVVGDGGRGAGTSDPTGNHALSTARERLRFGCRHANEELAKVQAEVRSALYVLDRVMSAVDPPPSANLRLEDQMRASRAEVAASREAQVKRNGRGEGWGG